MEYHYSLKPIFKEWRETYQTLRKFLLLVNQKFPKQCVEREIYVEGLFLRFVTSWESFLEEYFLRCMCGAKTVKWKRIMKPVAIRPYYNTEKAFVALASKPGKNRENIYMNWLSTEFLNNKIKFFKSNSRIQNCLPNDFKTINHVVIVRNRVVHRSKKAIKAFQDLVSRDYRYLSSNINSPYNFLLSIERITHKSIFEYYITKLDTLSERLSR